MKADDTAFLRRAHARCQDRIAELRAKTVRNAEERWLMEEFISACQFFEKTAEELRIRL